MLRQEMRIPIALLLGLLCVVVFRKSVCVA